MIKTNDISKTDQLLTDIADYVVNTTITSEEAYETARYVLLDTLGVAFWPYNILNARNFLAQ